MDERIHVNSHPGIRRWLVAALSFLFGISPLVLADEAADRAAIEVAAQTWMKAFNARDAHVLAALATQDVVLLDPNAASTSGREAARGTLRLPAATAKRQVTSTPKEVVIVGDVAWRIGALTLELPNGDSMLRGQSLEIWKRENGKWKLHRRMSSDTAAQSQRLLRPDPTEPVLDN